MPGEKIKVPGNLVPPIDEVSRLTGVPFAVIAATIQTQIGWPNTLIPSQILAVGRKLAESAPDPITYPGEAFPEEPDWTAVATSLFGGGNAKWRTRFEDIYGPWDIPDDARWVYDTVNQSPRETFVTPVIGAGIGGDRIVFGGVGGIPGLSKDDTEAVQRIADSLYLQYKGRLPTTQEYVDISRARYTPATLEEHLRAEPYGGTTRGKWEDAKAVANHYAQQQFGRDADPGEVNFLVTSGISAPDSVSAYYEQLRQRHDSGDPAFAWAADPKTWRDTQATVEGLWKRSGLTSAVDPHLVNQAITSKWTQDDIQREIDRQPAPGFAEGVTVGAINRIKPIAQGYKDTISHIHQGESLTNEEIGTFIGLNPAAIRDYYRELPAAGRDTTESSKPAQGVQ